MQLIYRGQSYESFTASQSGANATRQPRTKLIYRGQTYYTTPAADPESVSAAGSAVTLIYRGITYKRVLRRLKSYSPSGALNWRYQAGH